MGKGIIAFGDIEIEEHKFQHNKNPMFFRRCRH